MKSTVDARLINNSAPIDDELRGTLSVLGWHRYRFPVPTVDLLICLRCAVGLTR
jgi:hypothetical protein